MISKGTVMLKYLKIDYYFLLNSPLERGRGRMRNGRGVFL